MEIMLFCVSKRWAYHYLFFFQEAGQWNNDQIKLSALLRQQPFIINLVTDVMLISNFSFKLSS